MISDFQLALGGAAAAIVVGVLVYNRWQETKYKRRAERAFGTDHPDVLIDGAGGNVNSANSANDRATDSRVEPAFASAPIKRDVATERVEPHIGGGLPRAGAVVPPTAAMSVPAPVSPRATNYQSAPAPMADDDFADLMPIGAIGEPVLGMADDAAHTVPPPALHPGTGQLPRVAQQAAGHLYHHRTARGLVVPPRWALGACHLRTASIRRRYLSL